ncbi:MAG: DUF1553 domain-containing protein [Verrucomicrobiales bacterium]
MNPWKNLVERLRWQGVAFLFSAAVSTHAIDVSSLPAAASGHVDFKRDIAPIFEKSCISCHGPEKQKGGVRLDQKAAALEGGDIGPVILPGQSSKSRLIHLVAGLEKEMIMPAKGDRLTAEQIGLLRGWIDQGADWPVEADETKTETWWSLAPLARPAVPKVMGVETNLTPIDAFIQSALKTKGLKPSPEADRAILLRRLYFDLTGLPPKVEDVESFVQDPDPEAYEKLVDRLLASPAYGERWARHWLDVVHYGDTHGYDKDQPRPNAWPYRDYVIRSFNEDKPYWQFAQEQIAGDVLFPGNPDAIEALGFISAGPWDLIGHAEVPETKTDGKIARHLDRDDMVANTMNTFTSMTVQCAQCHNHKFDPISAEDYYSLQAVFAAVDRTNKEYDRDPAVAAERMQLSDDEKRLSNLVKDLRRGVSKAGGEKLAILEKQINDASKSKPGQTRPEYGYHSAIEPKQEVEKWVEVDLGSPVEISKLALAPTSDDFAGIGDGFGFPLRYKVEGSLDPEFKNDVAVLLDRTGSDQPKPGIQRQIATFEKTTARYIRVTATKLAHRQSDYIFALAEVEIFDAEGKNVASGAKVSSLDSIEAPVRWAKRNLTDGIYPGLQVTTSEVELAKWKEEVQTILKNRVPLELLAKLHSSSNQLASAQKKLAALPPPSLVFVGAVHHGGGAFRGTGPDGGKPRPIHLLNRGDVRKPIKEVVPGTFTVTESLPSRFDGVKDKPEGERRAALSQWITDTRHPLTWRSIVNRVWQYHFGKALVESPNDFGRMGRLPSHPELLDWLAVEFRDGGQSFKKLHKLIVTSSAYKQVSHVSDAQREAAKIDGDNQFLWRMNRRKLEAEAIRDTVLLLSGKLNSELYGPAFQDFIVDKPEHSPHYEYHLHDPNDPRSHRRSIYRFIVRSQPQPFMSTLDCADPSMLVEKRNESVSPMQALTLLNNDFMVVMAGNFASRLESRQDILEAKVVAAFKEALSRQPTQAEKEALTDFAQANGMANYCRLLFNLNEFMFVD